MKFKDIPEQAHFKLTEDDRIGLDIVYIKAYQDEEDCTEHNQR